MSIKKLSEYMSFVECLDSGFYLSRGQSRNYPLLPSALRCDENENRRYSKRSIRRFLEEFKINSYQYMPNPWDVSNDIEWMLYAQHYGIPTKLMDFTTSHITSLLFAVEGAFRNDTEEDAVVYFLNPRELNIKFMDKGAILNLSAIDNSILDGLDGPVVVQGRKLNPRINAQKGVFVLFNDEDKPLDSIDDKSVLLSVKIDRGSVKNILSALYSMGVTFTHVYPELGSVARDILMKQDIEDFIREDQ